MGWIRVSNNLHEDPKVLKASRELDVSVPTMIGHLVILWDWSTRFAPEGDISEIPNWIIERAALWTGQPDAFFDALVAADFLWLDEDDDRMLLCEWEAVQ